MRLMKVDQIPQLPLDTVDVRPAYIRLKSGHGDEGGERVEGARGRAGLTGGCAAGAFRRSIVGRCCKKQREGREGN